MKLIKDLGMQYPKPESKRKYRYGLYECPDCSQPTKAQTTSVNRGQLMAPTREEMEAFRQDMMIEPMYDCQRDKDVDDALALEDDRVIFEAQRAQLAIIDLKVFHNQSIDITDETLSVDEKLLRMNALNLTFERLKGNLVAGALALKELKELKESLKQDIVEGKK